MGEAVENSLQYLTSEDVSALIASLHAIAAQKSRHEVNSSQAPSTVFDASRPKVPRDELGRHTFEGACVNCHQYSGDGRQTSYASLIGSRAAADPDGANGVQLMPSGAKYRFKDQNV
jgi:cytochrome c